MSGRDVGRRHRPLPRIGTAWLGVVPAVLAGLTLILVLLNIWLVLADQSRQAEVAQRQQYIDQSVRLGRINAGLVRALASAAITNKDDKLRALLTEQGINVTYTPKAAATPTAPAANTAPATPAAPATAAAPKP